MLLARHAGKTLTMDLAKAMVNELFEPQASKYSGVRADLFRLCGANDDAMALIEGVWGFCEVWDDCIDRDNMEPEPLVNQAMLWALCDKEENPFLIQHPHLREALRQMAVIWLAANQLERSGNAYKVNAAYTLRCSPYLFFVSVVTAAAGMAAGVEAAELLFGNEFNDTLQGYLIEHTRS